eukprot:1973195-Amphidinium_carterae.1
MKVPKPELPEWQFVIGKRGRQGHCDELSFVARCSPLVCANRFAALEREMNIDEEEFFFMQSRTRNILQLAVKTLKQIHREGLVYYNVEPRKHLGVTQVACPDRGDHST